MRKRNADALSTFEYHCIVVRSACEPVTSIYQWGLKSKQGTIDSSRSTSAKPSFFPSFFSLVFFCSPHLCVDISSLTFASFPFFRLALPSPFHDRSQKFATAHCDGGIDGVAGSERQPLSIASRETVPSADRTWRRYKSTS